MKIKTIVATLSIAGMLAVASCSTPKDVVYFQDLANDSIIYAKATAQIRIKPKDQLSITVSTPNQILNDQFNLSNTSRLFQSYNSGLNQSFLGYTVDSKGDIDFPELGELHVEGLTREEVAQYIKKQLQEKDYVKNPVVTVQFMNLGVNVLGEVRNPGRVSITRDKLTVLDAIADAGDLTINGKRGNVMVIRNEGDEQKVYTMDLTNAASVYNSPAYYMQQEDVIYVTPNKQAIRQSTVNGNTLQTYGFWLSLATFLMSAGVLIFK